MQKVLLVVSAAVVIPAAITSVVRLRRRRAGRSREFSARLVEPSLAAAPRDPAPSSKRRGRRGKAPDPRSNGHAKQNGHGTLP